MVEVVNTALELRDVLERLLGALLLEWWTSCYLRMRCCLSRSHCSSQWSWLRRCAGPAGGGVDEVEREEGEVDQVLGA